jgi:hypothetical protein
MRALFRQPVADATPQLGRPAALMLLLGSGGAWAALVHAQAFAAFDPGAVAELCLSLGSGAVMSVDRLWLFGRQMFFDGLLMVLAMMLPGAIRGSAAASCCEHARWLLPFAWMAAYVAMWCAGLLAVLLVAGAAAWLGWLGPDILPSGAVPQALACCAAVLQCRFLLVPAEAARRAAPQRSASAAWHAGLREGARCMQRCALPMIALHAVYGMSLIAMAAYALWFWWRASTESRWPHAAAALAFVGSAAAA